MVFIKMNQISFKIYNNDNIFYIIFYTLFVALIIIQINLETFLYRLYELYAYALALEPKLIN